MHLLSITLGLSLVTASCSGKKLSVSSSEELQKALDDASPGDTIGLKSAIYTGKFTITKSGEKGNEIVLVADDKKDKEKCKIVGEGAEQPALTVEGNFWKLDYFSISNKDGLALLVSGTENSLNGLAIHGVEKGIVIKGKNNTVEDCAILKAKKGIFVEADGTVLKSNSVRDADPSIFADKSTCCGIIESNSCTGKVDVQGKDYKSDQNVIQGIVQ